MADEIINRVANSKLITVNLEDYYPEGKRVLFDIKDWLFQDGNYHIDVSHLNSVVRFARFLDADCPELDLATQLAQYGSQLDQQYQYPAEPPFDDYYAAHLQFFNLLNSTAVDDFQTYVLNEGDEYVPSNWVKPRRLMLRIGLEGTSEHKLNSG